MEKKKMIKNVIFDLGNVLISFDRDRIISRFTDIPEERDYLFNDCFLSPEWPKLDLGLITAEEAAEAIKERAGHRYDRLTGRFFADWYKTDLPNRDALALAESVKDGGYKVYVLSNMQSAAAEYFIGEGLFRRFDGVVISAFEHMKKPDAAIFRVLLDRYGADPRECLFVDDDDTGKSFETARSLGIYGRAVKPNDAGDIAAVLNEYGVLGI